jgi:hypothetical protein
MSRSFLAKLTGHKNKAAVPEPPLSVDGKPAPIAVHRLDFDALGLPEYSRKFALVLDNVFTPKDCDRLIKAAEASSAWKVVQIGGAIQYTDTSYRSGGRIMLDDVALADWVLGKIRPYLGEIEVMAYSPLHERLSTQPRHQRRKKDVPARLHRLNERLRFLRYEKGDFFKPHCDGTYYTPDRKEVSYYTLHLYLNGTADTSVMAGGATRFFSRKFKKGGSQDGDFMDVEARVGRVLVFEQEGILHSGEEVTKGIKLSMRTDFMYIQDVVDGGDGGEAQ